MTTALKPTVKSKKQSDNTETPKKFPVSIADQLMTVSWSNDSHQTGLAKLVYRIPTFPLTANAVLIQGQPYKNV